ncbi:MAG: biotin/lipoyl-binding protein, partial [Planctomycetes bacterium]|nr:biotin/lipoyl-binding protein [Planctomycetota bacterium]
MVILALLSGCDSSATEAAHSLATDAAPALDQLAAELEKLPELEQQAAERVARHIAASSREDAVKLANAIRAVKAAPSSSSGEKRPIPITTRPATQGDISSYYKTNATLEVDKDADIVARVNGLVKKITVEEGDEVETGAVLLEIENDEYKHRVTLSSARAQNLKSKRDRLEALTDDLVSAQERETAESEYNTAMAELELAKLNLSYSMVRAPFAGRVVT